MENENLVQYVLEAQKGNEDAFAKLYSRTLKNSYYLCLKLTADNAAAEDILKKAYATAFCSIDKLKRPEAFEAWLKQKIAGEYKNSQKFVYADADGDAQTLSSEFLPASVLEDESLCRKVEDDVSYLPKEQRTVTVLYYCVGMPVDFIAKFMSVSVSTVNSLLAKARKSIAEGLDFSDDVSEEHLPVLTRIFQRSAAGVSVDNAVVRGTFVYCVDAYEKQAEEKGRQDEPVAETKDDVADNSGDNTPEAKEEEPAKSKDEVVDIPVIAEDEQQKDEPATIVIDENTKPSSVVQSGADLLREIHQSISDFTEESRSVSPVDVHEMISLDNAGEPTELSEHNAEDSSVGKVKKTKSLSAKSVLYIVLAVLLVVALIVGAVTIKKSKNNNGENDTPSVIDNNGDATAVNVKWLADIFTDCEEIDYLNEYCCEFKSVNTQKWGLMDYQGNILLQPQYYEFVRCSYGRQYKTDRSNYHILVRLESGGELFEVSMTDFKISDTPHAQHNLYGDEVLDVDTDKFNERDRYHNGYAAVRDKDTGKWGYISEEKGKLVIPCLYEAVNTGLEDAEYAMVDYCLAVENNMVAVKKGEQMGILAVNGDEIVKFEYNRILQGKDGVFIAEKGGKWGVILVGDAAINNYERNTSAASDPALDEILKSAEKIEGTYEVVRRVNARSAADSSSDDNIVGEVEIGAQVKAVAKYTDDEDKGWLCFEYSGGYAWGRITFFELMETEENTSETENNEVG